MKKGRSIKKEKKKRRRRGGCWGVGGQIPSHTIRLGIRREEKKCTKVDKGESPEAKSRPDDLRKDG